MNNRVEGEGIERQESIRKRCAHPDGEFESFEKANVATSIPDRFRQQVRSCRDRIAVTTDGRELTYEELDLASNRVARACVARLGASEARVGVLLSKDAPLFPAILGTLKAGKTYVPLDPSLPLTRLRYIIDDARPRLLITDAEHSAQASELDEGRYQMMSLDELPAAGADDDLAVPSQPDSPAWVVYTSGSTGKPKGVVQTHGNVLHYVMNYTNYFHISPADRLTLLFRFSVNGACHDIFLTFLTGASLAPYDVQRRGIAGLADWMKRRDITVYCSVPSVFRSFVAELGDDATFPRVRLVRLIGEPVYKKDVEAYKKHFPPPCTFVNRLGSTETGSMMFYFIDHQTRVESNNVPVGFPVFENEILLLDENGDLAPDGEIGEIAVKSRYLSPGYFGRPDLTRKAFVTSPDGDGRMYRTGDLGRRLDDGRFVCLGRKDFQVKIRGHRIELAEIELALEELDSVETAVVMARERRRAEPRLVGYVVPAGASAPTVSGLRRELERILPVYMVPSTFVTLKELPRAPNGKIDRGALPVPGNSRPKLDTPFVPAGSPVEQTLAEIWSDVLELDRVGIHDVFVELGGDSLLAARVMSRVRDAFDLEIPMATFFRASTVAELGVAMVESMLREDGTSEQVR